MKIRRIDQTSPVWLKLGVAMVLIVFAVASRLMPHPDNIAPIAAIALFAGAVMPRRWALALPLAAMVVSDMFIGLHDTIIFTWGSFVLIALGGYVLMKRINPLNVLAASFLASVLFYTITNFGVWLVSGMYSPTAEGLVQSYVNALPFFRNTLAGDLLYTGLLFGVYALAYRTAVPPSRRAIDPQRT